MDLRQLQYFVATAEELNFTRAARRCNISQPPLSRAIALLEAEVGAKLFDRDRHKVALTAAGETFLGEARRGLDALRRAAEGARLVAEGRAGTLAVGFGGTSVYALIPALVGSFRDAAPTVAIHYRAMPVLRQIEALRDGAIDIGIVRLPIHDELVATLAVHEEPLVLALRDDHPLAAHDTVSLAALRRDRFVTYQRSRGFGYHADLTALCALAGFKPDIAQHAETTEAVIGIVACGEGVAVVPASAGRLRMEGVAFRALDRAGLPADVTTVRFAIAWCPARLTPVARRFVDHVRTQWKPTGGS